MSTQNNLIQKTLEFAKTSLESDSSGHDFWHIYRVWQNAKNIAKLEVKNYPNLDIELVEITAILHDISDYKSNGGDELLGGIVARDFLIENGYDKLKATKVQFIIDNMSFKGSFKADFELSIEGKIVQDADRLEAIGAMGIARAFAYGGNKGRQIYNPEIKPVDHKTSESYKQNKSTSLNHFYEKLLLLKDKFNTQTAKKVAENRSEFMQKYLDQFFLEWDQKEFLELS